MTKVLVIGASGQLGAVVLDRLLATSRECVAFVRPASGFIPPASAQVKIVRGDLADFASVDNACVGVKKVIATASSIVPRLGDKFGSDEVGHYRNLIKACRRHAVEHLVYISAFSSPYDKQVPEFRIKRQIEQLIVESGISFTIFRAAAFMDVYYAVLGSRLATTGVSHPTLLRGFWLTKFYARATSGWLEKYGIALVPGSGKARHNFICIDDVATFMVKALTMPSAKNRLIELGGPQALSWREVVDIYAQVLNKKVIKLSMPGFILNFWRLALRPFSPAGENIMSLLSLLGRYDAVMDMAAISAEFAIRLTDTRGFLLAKIKADRSAYKKS
ncbi:MAG: hypothetical protein CVV13_05645 [Gammaproteobacteria bacterium HGW-Gammaproteobacteria-3]|nr:MAG: hypothetical protein CVV13_05645 [Gammaproteobacteria bacterium HGW-Gammaproteobacteria-3]